MNSRSVVENPIGAHDAYTGSRRLLSLGLLIFANLLPVLGVLLFGWDVAALMILYWSENLVIGFYTLIKMLLRSPIGGVFSSVFFCIHYGGFCAVHGLFIFTILIDPEADMIRGDAWPLMLVFIQMLVAVVQQVLAYAPSGLLWAFFALWLSHGISFIFNYLWGGERDQVSVGALMMAPYGRVVVLHLAVLLGAILVMEMGEPIGMLLVLVLLKIGVDVAFHLREHKRLIPEKWS